MLVSSEKSEGADFSGNGAYTFWNVIYNAVKARVCRQIEVVGSADKAWEVLPEDRR